MGYAGDGCASLLFQLSYHGTGRTDAQAVPHANLACNECHAPTALLSKLPFKAKEGARDFYMNTLGDVDLPIVAGMATKDVVNANCKACHFATNENVASMDAKPYCVDCHRSAQHMRMKPISTRMVADE